MLSSSNFGKPFPIIQDTGMHVAGDSSLQQLGLQTPRQRKPRRRPATPMPPLTQQEAPLQTTRQMKVWILPLRQVFCDRQHFIAPGAVAHVSQLLFIAQLGTLDSSTFSTCLVMWLSPYAHDQLALLFCKYCCLLVWLCKQKAVPA